MPPRKEKRTHPPADRRETTAQQVQRHRSARRAASLADRFGAPPFSVLDARQGYWRQRRREWLAHGLRSQAGRADFLALNSDSSADPSFYSKKREVERRLGRSITTAEFERDHYKAPEDGTIGTSVFDPVLCELMLRWFRPEKAKVLDPFAGGSVRGVVSSILGRSYTGVDLRPEQVQANEAQARPLKLSPRPRWIVGDSRQLRTLCPMASSFDFILTCPPYADLEVYSDDPRDLSRMDYPGFVSAMRDIAEQSVQLLAEDRFACVVIGDARDRRGILQGVPPDTERAFIDAGLRLYNRAVLVTPVGSLAVRAPGVFRAGRKLGAWHQDVLLFVKGDPKRAAAACEPADITNDTAGLPPDWIDQPHLF